jgi:lipoate synthase
MFRPHFVKRLTSGRLEALKQRLQAELFEDTTSLPGNGRLPEWLRAPIPTGEKFSTLKDNLRELKLHTVSLTLS